MKKILLIGIGFHFGLIACAQLIDNTSTFRNINAPRYFRFHYDNDYFTKSDEYYTQGITLEYVHPGIKKFLPAKLLYTLFSTEAQYGITVNLFGYTPTTIKSDNILYGDRPFDANISLTTFSIQADDVHRRQISTAFSIGVMGQAALGKEIQTGIHRWLKNPLPHGWQHQIRNDIIINYRLQYEKQLFGDGTHFLLNSTAEARAGTLNDKVSGGFNFMTGRFNKRFSSSANPHRKAEYYFYGQSRVHFIGFDASLQGGLFNRTSPYHIPAKDISRITFQADAGVIVSFKNLFLSYTQSYLTKEFSTGHYHRWGGVSFGLSL
ncbi:MAG: lipid A deacylase LpxR family protein [Chitinophagaceae bacterium]